MGVLTKTMFEAQYALWSDGIGELPNNEVLRNKLWIGDVISAKSTDFNAIVSIGSSDELYPHHPNVEYFRIRADDLEGQNLMQYFERVSDFIDRHIKKEEGKVLVHCFAGISRSATICIAYLMCKHHLSLVAAYMVVRSARSQILPNKGFMKQLVKFESSIKKNI